MGQAKSKICCVITELGIQYIGRCRDYGSCYFFFRYLDRAVKWGHALSVTGNSSVLTLPLKESMKGLKQRWASLMDSVKQLPTIRLNWKISAGIPNWLYSNAWLYFRSIFSSSLLTFLKFDFEIFFILSFSFSVWDIRDHASLE